MRLSSALSFSGALAVAVVPFVAGCDIFGIRCDADSDCPDAQPFCNLGLCSTEDGPVRAGASEGEGEDDGSEGEGEGGPVGCGADADCGTGLCYDAPEDESHFDAGRAGTCVPGPDDDADCAAAAVFGAGAGARPTGGQAIFDVSAVRSTGDCPPGQSAVTFTVSAFDREADAFVGEGIVFVAAAGDSSPRTEAASVSGNSGEHTLQYFAGFGASCYDDALDEVAVAVGLGSPGSNAVCVTVTAAP